MISLNCHIVCSGNCQCNRRVSSRNKSGCSHHGRLCISRTFSAICCPVDIGNFCQIKFHQTATYFCQANIFAIEVSRDRGSRGCFKLNRSRFSVCGEHPFFVCKENTCSLRLIYTTVNIVSTFESQISLRDQFDSIHLFRDVFQRQEGSILSIICRNRLLAILYCSKHRCRHHSHSH